MFIPIKDDAPTLSTPYVTISLIALNTLIFLYGWTQGVQAFQLITFKYGFIPYELMLTTELHPQIAVPYLVTPFTSMFMHGGWMHLLGNMLFLWVFGNNIEDYFGSVKFVLFYIAAGLAAVALFTFFSPHSQVPLVGASGAIAGVMGGYLVLHPKARITVLILFGFIFFREFSAKTVLIIWFALQLVMSMMNMTSGGGVAWMAHVGGFAFGWMILRLFIKNRGQGTTPSGGQRVYRVRW